MDNPQPGVNCCEESSHVPEPSTTVAPGKDETAPVPIEEMSTLRVDPDGEPTSAEVSEARTVVEKVKDENNFVYYKCRFCGLTYNYMNTLRAHERVHNVDQPYKCTKCSESFHFMCQLEYHAKQHSDTKGYKCECGRTFHTYTDLLYHEHPGEDGVVVQVPEAVVIAKTGVPIPETEFPAPDFAVKGYEPKHPMKVYSDVRSKPYICQYCSKAYADSRGLAQHMYSHRGEKIFNPRASRYLMGRTDYSSLGRI